MRISGTEPEITEISHFVNRHANSVQYNPNQNEIDTCFFTNVLELKPSELMVSEHLEASNLSRRIISSIMLRNWNNLTSYVFLFQSNVKSREGLN